MKNSILFQSLAHKTRMLMIFTFLFTPFILHAQYESTYSVNNDQYSIGISGGPTLFWGDIDAKGKANGVLGVHANIRLTPYLTNSLTIYRGKMQGEKEKFKNGNPANMGFKNDFWQIDRIYKFYPLSHPKLQQDLPISPYLMGGIGLVNYKSYKYNTLNDKIIDWVGYSREAFKKSPYRTDLIIPFGLGVEFPVGNMFTMFLEHKLMYTHSDLLDAHAGAATNVNDWYSFTSLGVNLNLDNVIPGVPTHSITKLFGESFLDQMTFGISAGALLFWGDGDQPTKNPVGKMLDYRRREWGAGLHVEKAYTEKIHLRLSSIFGQFTGIRKTWTNSNPANTYFKNKFISFDLAQKYYFISNPEKVFSMYGFAGIGIIAYRSAAYNLLTDKVMRYYGYKDTDLNKDKRKIDPIIPFGLGADLNFQYGISLFIEQSIIYSHTDYLDAWKGVGSGINDFYSYTNFGVKYSIFNREKSFYN
jgi:hypothetical protein